MLKLKDFAKFALLGCAFLAIAALFLIPEAPIVEASPGWTTPSSVHSKCGEETGHEASKTIDGDTGTYWNHNATCYHWIVFDMGETKRITKVRLYQDYMSSWGQTDGVTVYVSDSTTEWGSYVWGGDTLGDSEWIESGTFDKNGRYIKLVSKSDYSGQWMMEFQAYIIPPPPTQPQLYIPENDSVLDNRSPYFEWTCGENADNHRILVDNDSDCSSPIDNILLGATENSWTKTGEYSNGTYYWKVMAIKGDSENASDIWCFHILPPSKPSLISPAENENRVDRTPKFEWTSSEGADNYRILIDDDSNFSSPIDNRVVSENHYTPANENELPLGTLWWKNIAINSFGENESDSWKFTILSSLTFGYKEKGTSSAAISAIRGSVFTCPDDGTVDSITAYIYGYANYFAKCAIYRESDYRLMGVSEEKETPGATIWLTFNFTGIKPVLQRNENYVLVIWGQAGSIYYSTGDENQGYENISDYNDFPDPITFNHNNHKYSIYASISKPVRTVPLLHRPIADAVENDVPYFEWTKDPNADNHRFMLDNDSDFSSPIENIILTENHFENKLHGLANDVYYWKVVGEYENENDRDSEVRILTVNVSYDYVIPENVYSMCGQETDHENEKAIDDNTSSYWKHNATCYHWIIFTMEKSQPIKKIRLYQFGQYSWGGQAGLTIYVSDNVDNFGDNVWEGDLYDPDEGWVESGSFFKIGKYVKLESMFESQAQRMFEFQAHTWVLTSDVGPCDYLIITRKMFSAPMQTFKQWKENKENYNVNLAFWEDLKEWFSGTTKPQKLRNAIKAYRDNGAKFVLLAGGYGTLDEREKDTEDWQLPIKAHGDGTLLSYYTCLDGENVGSWTGEDNLDLGPSVNAEVNENEPLDWSPDVYVGWFYAKSEENMTNIVDKTKSFVPYTKVKKFMGINASTGENDEIWDETNIFLHELLYEDDWWKSDISYVTENSAYDNDPSDWNDHFIPPSIDVEIIMDEHQNYHSLIDNNVAFLAIMGHEVKKPTSKPKVGFAYTCWSAYTDVLQPKDTGFIIYAGATGVLHMHDSENYGYMEVAAKGLHLNFWRQFFRRGITQPGVAYWEGWREMLIKSKTALIEVTYDNDQYRYRDDILSFVFFGDPSLYAVEAQWNHGYSYHGYGSSIDQIVEDLQKMENLCKNQDIDGLSKNIFKYENLGLSADNHPIPMAIIGEGTTNFYIEGGIHGDEPLAVEVPMDFINFLLVRMGLVETLPDYVLQSNNYEKPLEILDNAYPLQFSRYSLEDRIGVHKWNISNENIINWLKHLKFYIVPVRNPHGYINEKRTNYNNKDLNRDFPTAQLDENYEANGGWGGWKQGTESETKAFLDLDNEKKFLAALSFHSGAHCLIYPWAYKNVIADNWYNSYFDNRFQEKNFDNYATGTLYSSQGYLAENSFVDWVAWDNKHTADNVSLNMPTCRGIAPEIVMLNEPIPIYGFWRMYPVLEILANYIYQPNIEPSILNIFIQDMDNVADNTLNVNQAHRFLLKLQDNDTLADIDEITLKLYENTKDNTETGNENERDFYQVKWTRSGGFEEVGPDNTSPYDHLVVENCENFNDSLCLDNIVFAVKLSKIAVPGNWTIFCEVTDNSNASDNATYQNKFEVNICLSLSFDSDNVTFKGWPGDSDVAAEENPITTTISANVNFDFKEKISGHFTPENEDNIYLDDDGSAPYAITLSTTYQILYDNVSWGADIQKYEYYFVDIPKGITVTTYFVTFYTELVAS